MEMIGVTIGIGEKYREYAEKSAKAFTENTGLPVRIIDDEIFRQFDTSFIAWPNEQTWYMKLMMFDLFPDVDNIVYFDCDWLSVGQWNPYEYANQDEMCVVRDRHFQDNVKEAAEKLGVHPIQYFNAGFYIVNRKNHKRVLDYARENYREISTSWGDQCATNWATAKLKTPMRYLNKRFNFMDYTEGFCEKLDLLGVHTSYVYDVYAGRKELKTGDIKPVRAMADFRGAYLFNGELVHLYGDGFTDRNLFWLVDQNNAVWFYDQSGTQITDYELIPVES